MGSWKKLKRSGHYHRTIKKEQENFVKRANEIRNELIANRPAFVNPISSAPTEPRISLQPTICLQPPARENVLNNYIFAASGICHPSICVLSFMLSFIYLIYVSCRQKSLTPVPQKTSNTLFLISTKIMIPTILLVLNLKMNSPKTKTFERISGRIVPH